MSLCGAQKPLFRKLVVLGDGGCGKTSLLNVFTRKYFPQVYEPTIFENYVYDFTIDDHDISLSLWDTAGQEEFDRLRTLSYADTHVVMLCFSVEERDSLDNVGTKWTEEVTEHCPNAKIMLTALKCDLRDDEPTKARLARVGDAPINYDEGLAVARTLKAVRYLECSAKHNRGVTEVFEQAARVAMTVKGKRSPRGENSRCVLL